MDNLLGLPEPQTYVSTISFYHAQDRVLGIHIKDQAPDSSTAAIEVQFSQVLYFNGPFTWPSADLWLEPSEISSELAKQIYPSLLTAPQLGSENFHLYSFDSPKLPVQILARTFEILA